MFVDDSQSSEEKQKQKHTNKQNQQTQLSSKIEITNWRIASHVVLYTPQNTK